MALRVSEGIIQYLKMEIQQGGLQSHHQRVFEGLENVIVNLLEIAEMNKDLEKNVNSEMPYS